MALPLPVILGIAIALVYYTSWYVWIPIFIAIAVIRTKMAAVYQSMLEEKVKHTKLRIRSSPQYDFERPHDVLPEKQQQYIVSLDATALAEAIRLREITSRDAMLAYIQQAKAAQKRTNCLTCHRFDEALEEADKLDAILASGGNPVGPLHGVPFSAKDNINLTNLDSTLGLTRLCLKPASSDAAIIRVLKQAGAIPFVKTNVHQLMMGYESSNPVHGVTSNPWDVKRVPGGSSGGEASLLAQKGSAFGLGTDLAGSVRIPAHFCGIYTVKPTQRLISSSGCLAAVPGQEAITSTVGPMCRSARDLDLVLSVLLHPNQWAVDPEVIPVKFTRRDTSNSHTERKMRIGYYTFDGFSQPHAACVRAVNMAVDALRKEGHELVEFKLPDALDALDLYFGLIVADGSKTQLQMLEGELIDETLRLMFKNRQIPIPIAKLLAFIMRVYYKWPRVARTMLMALPKTVQEVWNLQYRRRMYRTRILDIWREQGIDCVLSPVHVMPAMLHGTTRRVLSVVSYTALYNLIDLPCGVLPITQVQAGDCETPREILDVWDRELALSEPNAVGLPIGVQVICKPFQEELCVDVLQKLSELLPFKSTPPGV